MIDALEFTHYVAARPQPLIESVLDYSAFALGPTPWTWLRYFGYHVVSVLVFAGVLRRVIQVMEIEPEPPIKRNVQMLVLSAVAVAISAVTVFPLGDLGDDGTAQPQQLRAPYCRPGRTFWFDRNRFAGSYCALTRASLR